MEDASKVAVVCDYGGKVSETSEFSPVFTWMIEDENLIVLCHREEPSQCYFSLPKLVLHYADICTVSAVWFISVLKSYRSLHHTP